MRLKAYRHEIVLSLVLVGMTVLVGSINPAFLSLANGFDLLKSSVVMGLFAVGTLIVLISGGIDISFTAIAAFAMYVTCRLLAASDYSGSFLLAFVLAALIGAGLGLLNAFFISRFNLPTLIVTLSTASMYRGFLLAFVGTAIIVTGHVKPRVSDQGSPGPVHVRASRKGVRRSQRRRTDAELST